MEQINREDRLVLSCGMEGCASALCDSRQTRSGGSALHAPRRVVPRDASGVADGLRQAIDVRHLVPIEDGAHQGRQHAVGRHAVLLGQSRHREDLVAGRVVGELHIGGNPGVGHLSVVSLHEHRAIPPRRRKVGRTLEVLPPDEEAEQLRDAVVVSPELAGPEDQPRTPEVRTARLEDRSGHDLAVQESREVLERDEDHLVGALDAVDETQQGVAHPAKVLTHLVVRGEEDPLTQM